MPTSYVYSRKKERDSKRKKLAKKSPFAKLDKKNERLSTWI